MIFKLLLFLSCYLPFQLAINPTKGIDLASIRPLILGIFFLWLFDGLRKKKVVIKNNVQVGLLVVFLFLSAFSIFFASNTDWSARKLLYLFSIFPIYFVALNVINSQEKNKRIVMCLVSSTALVAIVGIFQFILQFFLGIDRTYKFWATYVVPPFLGNSFSQMVLTYPSWLVNISGNNYLRATSIFPDPHTFSFFLGLIVPLSMGIGLIYKKNVWLMTTFLILLADILTFSRGGYIGLISGVIFASLIFWNKLGKKYKSTIILGTSIFLLVIIVPNPVSARFFSIFNLKEGSNSGRIQMWQKAVEVIAEKPFFGTGIGNFPLEVNPLATYREPIYAHNTYLDIMAESGILAGLVWIGLLFFTIVKILKKAKKEKFYLYLAVSLIIFSAHSLVDTVIYSPVVLTLFLILISLAYSNESEKMA